MCFSFGKVHDFPGKFADARERDVSHVVALEMYDDAPTEATSQLCRSSSISFTGKQILPRALSD